MRTERPPADLIPMTSPASSATWLPAAIARAAVVTARPAQNVPGGGRHFAPVVPTSVRIATPDNLLRTGRHAEPEWSRDLYDPERDEVDSLSWLGFAPAPH